MSAAGARLAGVAFVVWLAASGGGVRAEEPRALGTVTFSWVREPGAETCPGLQDMARAVRARLGRDPFSFEAARSVEATVRRADGRWVVHIALRDGSGAELGARELVTASDSCPAVAAAAALAIALVIDPNAALVPPAAAVSEGASPPAGVAEPARPAEEAQEAPPALDVPAGGRAETGPPSPDVAPERGDGALELSLRALFSLRFLPEAQPGVGLAVERPLAGALVWQVGVLWLPAVTVAEEGVRYSQGFTAAWLAACARLAPLPRVSLRACLGASPGVTQSVVLEPAALDAGEHFWVGLRPSVEAAYAFGSGLRLSLGVDVPVSLVRRRFLVDDRTVFRQRTLDLQPFVGVGGEFD